MKLDLLYEIDVPKPWGDRPHPYGQREAEQRSFYDAIEQIKLADSLGFNTSWHVEHHFREGRSHCPAPEVLIGALSQVTENIRLGFGVTLVPHGFGPPMRVAEKVATADILSKGRIEWGTGRSTPMEQIAFGVDRENSKDQARESIQAIVQMWESEYFEFHGKYLDFPRRMVTPKPYQDPHPPGWMAATSPSSAKLVGDYGLGLLSFAIMQPLNVLKERIDDYKAAAANPVQPLTRIHNNRVAAYTLVHCAETMAECEANGIWDAVWWWYQNLAEFTLEWEFAHFSQEEKDQIFPLLRKHAAGEFKPQAFNDYNMIIVGDPDQCLQKMIEFEKIGVDQLLCYVQFGKLSHTSIMKTIELLGTELIPQLAKREITTEVTVTATTAEEDDPSSISGMAGTVD
jgi:alkanesulfonate monooxygenase SsuD/methylene tetrahydromethanopterin reductase-like flavin-dependent oxidoreductase (luciferase family)